MSDIRVVSWNIQGVKKAVGARAIADALLRHEPSVMALQEFDTGSRGEELTGILQQAGYSSFGLPARQWKFRTMTFGPKDARLMPLPPDLPSDYPFRTELRWQGLNISTVHIPLDGRYPEWRLQDWESITSTARYANGAMHLVIGDFNTTRHGIDEVGKSVPGDHWLRDLEELGWAEAWRKLHHDPVAPQYTWAHNTGSQFRIDQAWLSPGLQPHLKDVGFDHRVRADELSDHSMMIVEFELPDL